MQSARVNLGSPRARQNSAFLLLNFNNPARFPHASARSVKLESGIVLINSHFTLLSDAQNFEKSPSQPPDTSNCNEKREICSGIEICSRNVITQHARRRGGDACDVLARHRGSAATVQAEVQAHPHKASSTLYVGVPVLRPELQGWSRTWRVRGEPALRRAR